jgi:hypothetical protein
VRARSSVRLADLDQLLVAQHDGRVIPKTRWARAVDGAYIAYQDFGEGAIALVVIHGWISHLEVYWEQPRYARLMNRLSSQMRVLVFDKRGTGCRIGSRALLIWRRGWTVCAR